MTTDPDRLNGGWPPAADNAGFSCRFCGRILNHRVVDLGMSPLCESYLSLDQLQHVECFYPLRVYVCRHCLLVQLQQFVRPEDIFSEYAYFSSYSDSWVEHARQYVEAIIERLLLDQHSHVVEIASNDGYLLQHFAATGIPAIGVEPAENVARVAEERGISTRVSFFGRDTARQMVSEGLQADLVIANNVLAQVPDLNDFVAAIGILLKPTGTATLEFPHVVRLIEENQFDSIYHEHFSYFSFHCVERVFAAHGLTVFDVELLPTHGGSLRIYVRRSDTETRPVAPAVLQLRAAESDMGVDCWQFYASFEERVQATKRDMLEFLIQTKRQGKQIAGYGAPGKGNTFLNYCGVRTDLVEYTVDRNPYKQGKFLPGTHIPIEIPERIRATRPDFLWILPWNLRDEIMDQLSYIRTWGGKFVVAIPRLTVE